MNFGKTIGSTLILTGTAIGAGMLALPLVSAASGFLNAAVLLIVVWALMTYTALLVLEVNLAFTPPHNSFGTMAKATLGSIGQMITWLTCLLLLYALTSAYIAGGTSLLTDTLNNVFHIHTAPWVNALLFTIILGGAVFWSTHAVDLFNRTLISIKGLLLIFAIILLMPHINFVQLIQHQHGATKYIWAAAPIFLTSFGFHTVIPSLSNYIGPKPKTLKWIIIIGALMPMIIYFVWLAATLGIIPLFGIHSFSHITKTHGSVSGLVDTATTLLNNRWISFGINGFSDIAMTTSFLGVSLGLFDFLADGLSRSNTRFGRLQTAIITFIPPLLFALLYPKGFILALGYAAIFVAILEIIIPALMVYKLRRSKTLKSNYRVFGNTSLLVIICIIGISLIVLQILGSAHGLPTL